MVLEGCRTNRIRPHRGLPGHQAGLARGGRPWWRPWVKNGVTSNYRYDLAPYTWELVKGLRMGTALFTQPPMPIKCAGAPQKALYLSADHWHRSGVLNNIDTAFYNAGGVLFGVKDYVPALMDYVEKYRADLMFNHNLVAVDGPRARPTSSRRTPRATRRRSSAAST